jgi:hypothetical protein
MMESFIVYNPAGSLDEYCFSDRNVYPNPKNKEWNISGSWNGKNIDIELFNVVGEKVYSKQFSDFSAQTVLNVSSAPFQAGIYFLRLQNGDSLETIKFIKEQILNVGCWMLDVDVECWMLNYFFLRSNIKQQPLKIPSQTSNIHHQSSSNNSNMSCKNFCFCVPGLCYIDLPSIGAFLR